ncbi:phage tail tape measure protein [Streptomyces sp. H39-C1]|uniref:phage tail tape measure protein n=1 Tax=Streptomyces sp. H39-C1 TaxID=3004355 RepID=UPI0022AE7D1C|nr:phage tail tape measure protein [Streptomyces sp. H39-C1]MCZ4099840.1 phage tail tape measure protein [Streptomyces sp. H39-C1]
MSSDTSLVFNIVARDRASEVMGKMKDKMTAASAAIGAGVAGALGVGIAANLDMATANSKLAAQLGVGPAEAAQLSKVSANVYANNWGESVGQVDEAIKGVYQNIGNTAEVKKGLEGITSNVLALSSTFDQDLGGVTNAVGQLMRTGLAKNAQQAMDIVTTGFQNGANKADDFLDTLNEYAPQFQKLHMSGTDALNGITQMVRAGAKDSDAAADAFKEFGLRAIDTAQSTTDAYKGLHLNADKTRNAIAAGGPAGQKAMQQVFDALKKVKDPVKQNQLGTALMGGQWEDTVRAILPKIDLTKNAIGDVTGATDKMAKTVGDNPAAAFETFKRKATMQLAEVAGKLVSFGMSNTQYMQPLLITLGGVAAVILAVRAGMILWTTAQTLWNGAMAIGTAVQWAFDAAMAASPTTWIILGIVALIAIIVVIATKTTWFQTAWHWAWGLIGGSVMAVWGWIRKNWPLLLAIITGPIGLAVLIVTKNWTKITDGGRAALKWFQGLPGLLGRALSGVANILMWPFKAGFNGIASFWNSSVGSLSFSVPGWVPGVGGKGFSFPHMPYLANGGHIMSAGWATVGERGPERLFLPAGATVAPLTRGGAGGVVTVVVELPGEGDFVRMSRKAVRVYGRGNVQVAFGTGG